MNSTQQQDEWLQPTIQRLTEWGHHLHSIHGDKLGYSDTASHLAGGSGGGRVMPESETAERIEQILCKVKRLEPGIYHALFLWYYLGLNGTEASDRLGVSVAWYRARRRVGEVMVAVYWDEQQRAIDEGQAA